MGVRSERKEETRRRIMEAAERLFRRHGIDGIGVDAIMREAGLTHGGFYLHFASKEALAAEVCGDALSRSSARWEAIAGETGGEEALARIVEVYLNPARISPDGAGCVVPVLGAELARRPDSLPALSEAIRDMAGTLAACRHPPGEPAADQDAAAQRGLADFACLVGGVVLARLAGNDHALSDQILRAARRAVLGGSPSAGPSGAG